MPTDRDHLREIISQLAALGQFPELSDTRFYEIASPLLDNAAEIAGANFVDPDPRSFQERCLDILNPVLSVQSSHRGE